MTMGMPYFHGKSGRVLHLVRYGALAGFHACVYMLMLGWAEALQSIKHIDSCRIHREINVT